jgi:hypothetical protein
LPGHSRGQELLKLRQIIIGLCAIGFFGAIYFSSYFLSVPQDCECRSTAIPDALSEALILANSIGDSSSITARIRLGGGELKICYSQTPKKGSIDSSSPGLPPQGCEYENGFNLEETSSRKNDIAAYIEYEIREQSHLYEVPRVHLKPMNGALYVNRSTNACTFGLLEWGDARLSGRLECADPVFYFNPWSWFPQTVELFYTRAFYAIHKKPAPAN